MATFKQYIKHKHLFVMMIPGILFYILFRYTPIYGLQIAFKDYFFEYGMFGSPWVGFDVFKDVFRMESFWQVFRNTLIISGYQLIFGFPVPIIFALFLNEIRSVKFKKLVQTVSYLPHFVSWVVLGGLFMQFLSPSTGPINILLKSMGLNPIYFLADKRYFRGVLVATEIWKSMGWSSIVYIAAITGIDQDMYEAAYLDGATRMQRIIHITLPSIAPVINIMFIFAIGKIINDNFDQVFNLYSTPVYEVGDVISTYVYRSGLTQMQFSFSTAIGLFKNIISFTLVLFANFVTKKIGGEGIW